MKESNKKRKNLILIIKILILICLFLILLVGLPYIINREIIGNDFFSKASNDGWVSFWGSYLGGMIGGVGTLIAVYFTIKDSKKQLDYHKKKQKKIENKERMANLCIITTELKMCFYDTFRILTVFSIENSKILMSEEEKCDWILKFKDILRGVSYSRKWRDVLKELVGIIDEDTFERIYEIFLLFEKVDFNISEKDYEYDNIYYKIQNIPREKIFSKEFLDKYDELLYTVNIYDAKKKAIEDLSDFKTEGSDYDVPARTKDIKNQLNEIEPKISELREYFKSKIDYYKIVDIRDIYNELLNKNILNDIWINVINDLEKRSYK